ncbi:MAG: segregation and condensation protein A [Anaerolineales bacterium]
MESEYSVNLPVFEGPLDLLLRLIEQEQLDITTVALSQVTDQFLEHLERIPEKPAAELAGFLVVAAKLLQIKSEALLPQPPEREPGEEDPAEALAQQLLLYRQFKEAATELATREQAGLRTYLRLTREPPVSEQLDLGGLGLVELRAAMLEALAGISEGPTLEQAAKPHKVHIRDKIRWIVNLLHREEHVSFNSLLSSAASRLEVVVSFLAVLELAKGRQVVASQAEPFADIELSRGPNWEVTPLEREG